MPALKIGVQLANLRLPVPKALAVVAEMGADAVELDARWDLQPEMSHTAVRHLRKLLADHNLRVSAIGFPTRRGYNVAENLEARVAGTKRAMKLAFELGTSVVVNRVGHIPADATDPQWQLLIEVLTDLGRWGQHTGALLAAQTGSESPGDLARLLAALPEGFMGVDLDPGELIVNGHSPVEGIEKLGPYILHVHAHDAVRDLTRGRGLEVSIGRGTTDFPALLGALEERNYRGYLTIRRDGADDPAYEMGEAVKYLRSL